MAERLLTALATAVFISGVVLLSLNGAAQEQKTPAEEQKVPDEIIIESTLYSNTYDLTKFSHKKHQDDYKIECNECHHVYEEKKNTWKKGDKVQKCQECHNEPTIKGEKKLPEDKKKLNLKWAFHANCILCCKKCHPAGKLKK